MRQRTCFAFRKFTFTDRFTLSTRRLHLRSWKRDRNEPGDGWQIHSQVWSAGSSPLAELVIMIDYGMQMNKSNHFWYDWNHSQSASSLRLWIGVGLSDQRLGFVRFCQYKVQQTQCSDNTGAAVNGGAKGYTVRMVKGKNIENNEIMTSEGYRLSKEQSLAYYYLTNCCYCW